MHRIKLSVIVLLLALCACDKAGTQADTVSAEDIAQSLVVVNTLAETLSVVDTQGDIHNNVQVTGAAPNAILHDAPYLYVVNSLSNSILVLKDSNLSVVREISVGAGVNPMHAALIRSRLLAVTGFLAHTLAIVDIDAGRVVHSIDLSDVPLPRDDPAIGGKAYPYGVAVSNGRIFVTLANLTDYCGGLTAAGVGVVAVFDAGTYASIGTIQLTGADAVYAEAYANKVFIACAGHYDGDITKPQSSGFVGDGVIEQIDPEDLTLERSYSLTAAPFSFSITPGGVLYASNAMGGQIPTLDLDSEGIAYLELDGAFISAVLAVGETIYALDFSSDQLYALNAQGEKLGRYTVGDGPIALLSLADVSAENVVIPKMGVYPEIASPGIEISFDASASLVPAGTYIYTWDFGDGKAAVGMSVQHAYQTAGTYTVTLTFDGDAGTAEETCVVTIVAVSPFAATMCAYTPAPGQFVNDSQYNDPAKALGPPTGGQTPLQPDNSSIVSLGGFGGSITLAFDHRILDNPGGYDFIVFGNAQYSGAPLRFVEPGIVEISEDGLTWFLIPGSHLNAPFARITKTYTDGQVFSAYQLPADTQDGVANGAYTLWGYADLSPVLALPTGADPAAYFTIPDDPILAGIATGTCGGDAFDIAWAVDPSTGAAANLSGFNYIRITTAVDRDLGGSLGELSTEIDAVADIGLE